MYLPPEDAWGLDVWTDRLTDAEVEASLAVYDDFYAAFAGVLTISRHTVPSSCSMCTRTTIVARAPTALPLRRRKIPR